MLLALLRQYIRPYRRLVAVLMVLQVISTLTSLYLPTVNAAIIDDGVSKGDSATIVRLGMVMLGVTALQVLCSVGAVYFGSRTGTGFGRDLRSAMFEHVITFSETETARFGAATLLTRSTNDVRQIVFLVQTTATVLVFAPIMCVGGIVMAIHQEAALTWLLLVCVPLLALTNYWIVSHMLPLFRGMQGMIDAINRVMRDQLSGVRVVRAFTREGFERDRFARANNALSDTALKAGNWQAVMPPATTLIVNLSSVALIWFGGLRIDHGQMQVGSLIAFLSYFGQILMAVTMATMTLMVLPRASVCAERITEVLSTRTAVASPPDPAFPPGGITGVVRLDGVTFTYPGADRPVLEDISLTALPGTTTAIVGSTGSGKSTLVSLICRLYDVTAGAVLVDDIDVRNYQTERLWSSIGLVPQRDYLFTGTVADNLRYGKSEAHRRRDVGSAAGGRRRRIRAGTRRGAAHAGRPGRHQLLRRAAPTAGDRPGGDPSPGRLSVRRRVLRAGRAHRLPGPRGPAGVVQHCHRHRCHTTDFNRCPSRPGDRDRRREDCRRGHSRIAAGRLRHLRGVRRLAVDERQRGRSRRGHAVTAPIIGPPRPRGVALPPGAMHSRDFWGSATRLVKCLAPQRRLSLAVMTLGIAGTVIGVIVPRILGHATDLLFNGVIGRRLPAGITKAQAVAAARARGDNAFADLLSGMRVVPGQGVDFAAVARTLTLALILYLIAALMIWLQARLLNRTVQRTMISLRSDIENKLHRLPLSYFDGRQRGELLSRVTNDIDNLQSSLSLTISQLVTALLTVLAVLAMMLSISPLLAMITVVTVPLSLLATRAIARRSRRLFMAHWTSTGRLNAHIEETYSGFTVVKTFGHQAAVRDRFRQFNDDVYEASFGAQFFSGLVGPATAFIGNLGYVAVAVVGGIQVATGQITLGSIQAFIQYVRQFNAPISQTTAIYNTLQSGVASAERVFDLLDEPEESPDPVPASEPPSNGQGTSGQPGRVEFRQVNFAYHPGTPVIHDLSMVAEPGTTVAIVGPTGAGKTTLVNLLMRFYDVDSGRILVDGVDITSMSRHALRSRIGMVLQDTWLFDGTIAENIGYGRPEARRRRDRGSGQGRPRRPVRAHAARRLSDAGQRRWRQDQRRREAAHHDRARFPGSAQAVDSGRSDQLGGHPHRGAHPAGHVRAAPGSNEFHYRSPSFDDSRCRPHRGGHRRQDRRARRPCRTRGAARRVLRNDPGLGLTRIAAKNSPRIPREFSKAVTRGCIDSNP